jgi:hypothetical protein
MIGLRLQSMCFALNNLNFLSNFDKLDCKSTTFSNKSSLRISSSIIASRKFRSSVKSKRKNELVSGKKNDRDKLVSRTATK